MMMMVIIIIIRIIIETVFNITKAMQCKAATDFNHLNGFKVFQSEKRLILNSNSNSNSNLVINLCS